MQLTLKSAILLPEEPFGVQLLRREHERQKRLAPAAQRTRRRSLDRQDSGRHDTSAVDGGNVKLFVREGDAVPGGDACIEHVAVLGNRVAWTSGSCVRKLFTLEAEVLQATWAVFPTYSPDPVLCLLSANCCLTTCTLGGELHESAVPPGLDSVWPAGDQGVLLGGPLAATLYLLSHPMDEPQPVVADVSLRAGRRGSYAGWSGEQVVWSSHELPYLATYSEAAGRLAIWTVGRAPLVPELLGNLPDIPAATPLGGAPGSAAGPLTGPGAGGGAPLTGMSAVTAATPISMMSMFSFQPRTAAGFGNAAAAAVAQAAGAAAGGGGGGAPPPPSFAAPRPPARVGAVAALVTPQAGANGAPLGPGQQPSLQPSPYYPPSAAPSDMAISPASTAAAATPPAGALGAAVQMRPPLHHPPPSQHLPQQPTSPDCPSSSAPSDMSMAFTPASQTETPQAHLTPPPPQQQHHPGQQHQSSRPPLSCPPSAAPSDMSIEVTHMGAATPAALFAGLPSAAAAAAAPAGGGGGGGGGRYQSPYGGGAAPSPMLVSPWMPAGAAASPGPAFGAASGAIPGTSLKRTPAARTPEGFLSPHLFNPKPRGAASAAAAAAGAAAPAGGGGGGGGGGAYPFGFLAPSPAPFPGQTSRAVGRADGQGPWPGTPFSQPLGAGGGGGGGPASTPGLLGATAGGRRGSVTHLTLAAQPGLGLGLGGGEECEEGIVMVLLHEEQLQPGVRPTDAVMATDLSGSPLLCVLCGQQTRLLAFTIAQAGPAAAGTDPRVTGGGAAPAAVACSGSGGAAAAGVCVSLAGTLEAVAVAAVTATRTAITAPGSPFPVHRDLLALLPSGQLVLHRGLSPLFEVSYASTALNGVTDTSRAAPPPAVPVGGDVPSAAAAAAGGGGGVSTARGMFGGGDLSTPASTAGTDMMLDGGSDMEEDSGDDDDDDDGHPGRGGAAGPPSRPSRPAPGPATAVHSRIVGGMPSVRSDDGMSEATEEGDMMMLSSPPTSGPLPAAAAAARVSAWKAANGPPPVPVSGCKRAGGAGATAAAAVVPPAAPAARALGLRRGVSNTVVLTLGPGGAPGAPQGGPTPLQSGLKSALQPPHARVAAQGRELRLLLPFAVTSALASRALEVVRAAAPSELYLAFLRRFFAQRPGATRRAAGEWAAFDAVLTDWANDPPAFAEAGRMGTAGAAAPPRGRAQPTAPGGSLYARRSGGSGGGGGAAAATPSTGGSGGLYGQPATPFSTPLHTRRFAAMTLASPAGPPKQPLPHPQPRHSQLYHHHDHHHQQDQHQHDPQQEQRQLRHQQGLPLPELADPHLRPTASAAAAAAAADAAGRAGPGPGSAWERLLVSETQARLVSSRRKPAWIRTRDPRVSAAGGPAAAAPAARQLKAVHALLGGGGAAAAPAGAAKTQDGEEGDDDVAASPLEDAPAIPLGPSAQPLLAVLYGLHGLYEELKLDVLTWPQLQPLGTSLAASASALGLHPYWEHYARDLGPAALLSAGAPEPPLRGPPGLVLRPPADIYRVLSRMVGGAQPEPSELPSLLDPTASAATHGSAAAAAASGAATAAAAPPLPLAPSALPLTSRLLPCYSLLSDCARSCAAILLDTKLKSRADAPPPPPPPPPRASGSGSGSGDVAALEACVRSASEEVVALVAAQGWDAGSLGRLPPGVALPLREAFQRCRASPPPGWPVQAYALIGREDIAATLAPSGLAACRLALTAAAAAATKVPVPPHLPTSPEALSYGHAHSQQQQQQQEGRGAAAAAAPPPTAAAGGFTSLLRLLPTLRTPTASGPSEMHHSTAVVTPTSITAAPNTAAAAAAADGGGGGGGGSEPNSASTAGGGGDGGALSTSPPSSSLFSFRQMPSFSLAAVTPSSGFTPQHGPFRRLSAGGGGGSGGGGRNLYIPHGSDLPAVTPGGGGAAAAASPSSAAIVPYRRPPAPPPPRPPPSYLWHMWRPSYTARLQLPSHQLDLGAELEAPRKLEGPAKQFESKHGMEGLTRGVSRLRFGRDGRLHEVISSLDSSHPLVLDGLGLHDEDPDAPLKQQQQLLAAALRTMSLPLGRGAVALATGRPLPTEPTSAVPSMCLAGLVPDSLAGYTVVNLDLSTAQPAPGGGAAADFTAWPEFHNGAAEGLRLSAGGGESLSRTWLQVATKPDVPSYTHAGLLMALGLTGHLDRLSWTDLYRYLSDEHDPTTIAVLVGMAAQRRGSMDPTVTRMLFLHLPARHPTTFPELELSPLVQAAALMGVGLLYEGSAHRVMAETLVEEIGRRPLSPAAAAAFAANGQGGGGGGAGGGGGSGLGVGSVPGGASLPPGASPLAVTHDREGYALAAGLALGMVVLGLGGTRAAAGLADLQLEERLTYYMLGSTDASAAARRAGGLSGAPGGGHYYAGGSSGLDRVFGPGPGGAKLGHAVALWGGDPAGPAALSTPAAARSGEGGAAGGGAGNGQGVALVVLEPDNLLNLSITSPAATVALALMYLRTNNAAIAARFQLPDTPFDLDCVRPDCITLRALGRALVMWEAIEPSEAWLAGSMPELFRGPLERLVDRVVAQLQGGPPGGGGGGGGGGAAGRAGGRGRGGGRAGGPGAVSADVHAVALAHVSALAGLCLAMGLKYAGSADSQAYETLRSVALSLIAAKRRLPEVAASSTASGGAAVATGAGQVAGGGAEAVGRLDRAPVEAALSVVVLALSVVMAGTGHLPTFRLLQGLSHRRHPSHHHVLHSLGVGYGAHCAVSLALGFLFLGAGTHTFSTTNSAVAALLVALFPTLPHTPTDNRCHLQVFRHLYVLAARRRCLEAVDVDSQQLVYVPLQLMVSPPRVVTPAAGGGRGGGQQAAGAAAAADGGGRGAAEGAAGVGEPLVDDSTVLRTSTKANLPWTPDGQLRPGIGTPAAAAAAGAAAAGAGPPATATVGVGTAGGPATAAAAAAASGSPPVLEALHLEGDSPGPAPLLRAASAVPGAATATTAAGVGPAAGKSIPFAAAAIASPGAPPGGGDGGGGGTLAGGTASAVPTAPLASVQIVRHQAVPGGGQVVTYERVAPALLPEPHQTVRVAVRGPRYWPQQLDWSSRGAAGADGTGALPVAQSQHAAQWAAASAAAAASWNSRGSAGGGGATAGGGNGAAAPPHTPYGQFPFATPLQGGGAGIWAVGGGGVARQGAPAAAAAMTPVGTAPPAVGAAFTHAVRGVVAPATSTSAAPYTAGDAPATAAAGGGCSALETVYRQLLLFVKKRAGSLSYSQDPSGIRSLLSRAFHNQGLLRMPPAHPPPPLEGAAAKAAAARIAAAAAAAADDDDAAAAADASPADRRRGGGGGSGDTTGAQFEWGAQDPDTDTDVVGAAPDGYDPRDGGGGGGGGERQDGAAPVGDGGSGAGDGGFDLVHLCATFSVDPSIMAFAQHIKAMRDLWLAAEADGSASPSAAAAEASAGGGGGGSGLRRGLVLLAPPPLRGRPRQHPPRRPAVPAAEQRRLQQLLAQRRRQRRRHGAELLSFCYSALYECITGEKTIALQMYLHLQCLTHRAASWGYDRGFGAVDLDDLGGGVRRTGVLGGAAAPIDPWVAAAVGADGPAHPGSLLTSAQVPLPAALRGLQLARAYYSGPLAAAAAAAAAATGVEAGEIFADLDEQALWRPLLQPAFLDSLWCTIQHRRWRPMGLLPSPGLAASGAAAAAAASSSSALQVYLRRGRILSAADFEGVVPGISRLATEAELQGELAAALALHGLPPIASVLTALAQLKGLPAWQQLKAMLASLPGAAAAGGPGPAAAAAVVRPSWALLPLLSLVMPGLSNEGLLLLAAAVTV